MFSMLLKVGQMGNNSSSPTKENIPLTLDLLLNPRRLRAEDFGEM